MLERKAYKTLLKWKDTHSKSCLMIKGARQVGKTFLVRKFGKNEYESFIEINFIKNPSLKSIFDGDLSANEIYKRMTAQIENISLIPGKTLIFLDEIQVCGKARTALKFIAEDNRFDVITSGSLLGLTYKEDADDEVEEPESIPTGYEDFLTLYSLDFEEFLWALGYKNESINILRDYYKNIESIPNAINEKYEELFREFIVVGGMPDVVNTFVNTHDFGAVDNVQKRILEDYYMDISKHAKSVEKTKIRNCYEAIPKQLAKELKKFQYSTVEKGQTSKKYKGSVQWLKDSAIVNACYNISEPYIPLLANAKEEQFKLYFNDTGLLCAKYGFETKRAILNKTIKGNAKGGIYENVIAECLIKSGYSLFYYKPDDDHELEFLLEKNGDVVPLEVKSTNTSTTSLNNFINDYKPSVALKLIDGGLGKVDTKITMPHYMIMFI